MSKRLTLLTLLALTLVLLPGAVPRAAGQDDSEPAVSTFELDADADADASVVCTTVHWTSGPRTCQRQHVDSVIGPLAPCSYIKVGGVWYHIRSIDANIVTVTPTIGTPVPEG